MRNLWLNSVCLVILFTGCVSIKPAGKLLSGTAKDFPTSLQSIPAGTKATLYKASFDIRKHHLSGLIVIRQMDDSSYRIVFANQVGMTYFDLQVKRDSFNIIYCFESLNKNGLMKVLETDFRLLLPFCPPGEKISRKVQESTGNLVFSDDCGQITRWIMYSPSGDSLLYIGGKSNFADAAKIGLSGYFEGVPGHISIENPIIGLKLDLRLLTK
jgi:hypothetical protein